MAKGLIKLSKAQVRELVRLHKQGLTYRALMDMFKLKSTFAVLRHVRNARKSEPPPYLRSTAPVYTPAFKPPPRLKTREEMMECEDGQT